jgi:hypothetical protein
MVYQGTVQNGVVVFNNGIHLPEGTSVRVEPVIVHAPEEPKKKDNSELDPIFRTSELAGDAGPPDLSVNIDHYLYGHPKVIDGQ